MATVNDSFRVKNNLIVLGTGTSTVGGSLQIAGALTGVTTQSMSGQLTSTLSTGTAPFSVASTTLVTNLNVGLLNGQNSAYYLALGNATGTLSIALGGTNGSATPTTGGVSYGTGTAFAFTAAGTSSQVLIGGASNPAWSNTPTLTGTNFTGIPNTGLTNSSLTIGSTNVALGATVTTFAGLTSVTSTTFVGALTGNASTATNVAWSGITSKPTTLSGFGITDATNQAIGFPAGSASSVKMYDNRAITNPSTGIGYASGMRIRFSALNDDSTSPYADVIDLSTYNDSSGGGYNSLYFNKTTQQIKHKFGASGATSWTAKELQYTDGTNASGTWGISISGSASQLGGVAAASYALKADTHFIGTTSIALNRASAAQSLTGITSIDGTASAWTTGRTFALTGDVTGTSAAMTGSANLSWATAIADATVTGKVLTGYTAGANTALAATDTILAAMGKIQGQITARSGTVTSVGGTGTVSGLTLTGTVTTTGNLTLGGTLAVTASNFASQTANTFLAAPNGSAGVPTFRTIAAADIPTLNQSTTGTASIATNTTITDDTTTAATMYPTWVTATTGNLPQKTSSSKLTFNPSTGTLAATTFSGAHSGSGASLTAIPNGALTNSSVTIGSTNVALGATVTTFAGLTSVTSTTFVGALTGASTSCSGNAATVTTNANLTGPITSSGNATSVTANAITNAMLAQVATASFHGRVTAGTGNVETLTGTQATTLLDVFSSTLKGLVPASGGGTTNFLRADGTWAAPAGGGGTTTNALTINNSGSGVASGGTFNGSAAVTISYNSIGAAPLASPTFTGTPSLPTGSTGVTQTAGTNNTTLATTAFTTTEKLTPRSTSTTTTATLTPTSLDEVVRVTAQSAAINVANPTGTYADNQSYVVAIKDDGTSRAITWGTSFIARTGSLPSATVVGEWGYYSVTYNSSAAKHIVLVGASGGGTTTNALTLNNSGSGASSGATFNGSAAVTLSYNTIGAAPLASPAFTGTPSLPTGSTGVTQTVNTSSTALATCAFVVNTKLTPKTQTTASSATVTPTSVDEAVTVTALAVACNFANPTGAYADNQEYIIAVKDNGTARALTWGTSYLARTGTLPSTTVVGEWSYFSIVYNSSAAKHIVLQNASGGGGTTTNALTMNNGGAGDASGTTFNGSAARTISYNTIGAMPLTPRVQTVSSASTHTIADTNDLMTITAQAANCNIANPTGTWSQGQPVMLRIKDNGTARSVWWGTAMTATNYIGAGTTTVTVTVASTTGMAVGHLITITGATGTEQSKMNGIWKINTVPNGTTFTVIIASNMTTGTYTTTLGTMYWGKFRRMGSYPLEQTVAGKQMEVTLIYNSTDSVWCVYPYVVEV